jgi:hypothetical protein
MLHMLKLELKRALSNKTFLFALLLGSVVAVAQFLQFALPHGLQLDLYLQYPRQSPARLFDFWMGGNVQSYHNYLYFLLLPAIAVLPFGASYFSDVKGGFIRQVFIRIQRKDYYVSKYVSVFISGGLAVTLPLILNFLLCCTIYPLGKTELCSAVSMIGMDSMWFHMYYDQPWLYLSLYLIIIFLFGGAIATVALAASDFVSSPFLVLGLPILFYLFFMSLCNIFSATFMSPWNPVYLLSPGMGGTQLHMVLIEFTALFAATLLGFFIPKYKKDIF